MDAQEKTALARKQLRAMALSAKPRTCELTVDGHYLVLVAPAEGEALKLWREDSVDDLEKDYQLVCRCTRAAKLDEEGKPRLDTDGSWLYDDEPLFDVMEARELAQAPAGSLPGKLRRVLTQFVFELFDPEGKGQAGDSGGSTASPESSD